jgi:hypothetical protein
MKQETITKHKAGRKGGNTMYYESLKTDYRTDYLTSTPRKYEAINNARIAGNVSILPNSNNRAVIIDTPDKRYLQSYDTLILETDKATGSTVKLWNGYSVTTLKHINEFLHRAISKREWNNIEVNGIV